MAETHTSATNDGFIARWSRLSGSRDAQLFGRLILICVMPLYFTASSTTADQIDKGSVELLPDKLLIRILPSNFWTLT